MNKLLLIKNIQEPKPYEVKNIDTTLRAFSADSWVGDLPSARFSAPASSKQQGVFQKLSGIVYIYLEICPDINNPLGGGATVSFTSGDVITLPFRSSAQGTYIPGQFVGRQYLTMTNLANGTQYTNVYVQTTVGNVPQIVINHTIGATASTFSIDGFYVLGAS